jgi:endogenous inhibitor of DNA gyrase (YacG/DUF329 family)
VTTKTTPADAVYVPCPNCGITLAAMVAGLYVVKRKDFEMVVEIIHSVRCSRCGTASEMRDGQLRVVGSGNGNGSH